MRRLAQAPRPDWRRRLESVGFHYHSIDEDGVALDAADDRFVYWREDVAWRFTAAEVDALDDAARELHAMCLEAVEHVVRHDRFAELAIGPLAARVASASWAAREPSLFGRFDLAWGGLEDGAGGAPKLLEYNADTPTSLVEASLAQWRWKEDARPEADQFNSLHEALIERWREIRQVGAPLLHLACDFGRQEDVGNVEYLMDLALQAGWRAKMIDLGDIGATADGRFVDAQDLPIDRAFKLYPWEWMAREPFFDTAAAAPTRWIEPAWKMVLSNKGLLPILWRLFPGHPNLLEAHFDEAPLAGRARVRKPLLSREGANVAILPADAPGLRPPSVARGGPYGAEGFVHQAYHRLPVSGGAHAVIGAWIVGDAPAGIGLREDDGPITGDASRFVPHYFVD